MGHDRSSWGLLAMVGALSFVFGCRSGCNGDTSRSSKATGAVAKELAAAQPELGIPTCDEYLSKVGRCISERAPDDKKKVLEEGLKRTRASWASLASNAGTRPSLGQTCELALTSAKASFASLSCDW